MKSLAMVSIRKNAQPESGIRPVLKTLPCETEISRRQRDRKYIVIPTPGVKTQIIFEAPPLLENKPFLLMMAITLAMVGSLVVRFFFL